LEGRSLRRSHTVEFLGLGLFLDLTSGSVEAVLVTVIEDGGLASWRSKFRTRTLDSSRVFREVGSVCALQSGNVVGRVRTLQLGDTVRANALGRSQQARTLRRGETAELDFHRSSVGGSVLCGIDFGQDTVEGRHGSITVSRLAHGTGRKRLSVGAGSGSAVMIVGTILLGLGQLHSCSRGGKLHAFAIATNKNGELVIAGLVLEIVFGIRRSGGVLDTGRLVIVLVTKQEAGGVDRSEKGRQFSHLDRHGIAVEAVGG
jgi:hypothetical protein